MKRFSILIILIFAFVLAPSLSHTATLNVLVEGLENLAPDTIWSYQLNFAVDGDTSWFTYDSAKPDDDSGSLRFNVNTQHIWQVTPSVKILNWNLNANITSNGELVILGDDKSYGDPTISPLRNGELFTLHYPDEVTLRLTLDSFLLSSDLISVVPMKKVPNNPVFGAGENQLTFAPVPIPATAVLLLSGIFGLVGIRRFKGGQRES